MTKQIKCQCECGLIFGLIFRDDRYWCSFCLWREILELKSSNAAMVRQFNDQDLRVERQHREWGAKMRDLIDKVKQLERRSIAVKTIFDQCYGAQQR